MAKKPFIPVVAVLNMKGGVGKTTVSANLFRRLYLDKEIPAVVLDLDPQFNLTQALFKRTRYDKIRNDSKTLYSVFNSNTKASLLAISENQKSVPEPKSLAVTMKYLTNDKNIRYDIIPGDFDLVRFSLMDDKATLKFAKTRFLDFIEKCKTEYKLVVLDCNPSSSFLTLCALEACTHVLVPVKMDKYSVLGLEMLWKFVHEIMPISPKPEFIILLNSVKRSRPTKSMVETEAELRGHAIFGARTLANTIRDTGQLQAKSDYTGFSVDRKTSISSTVQNEIDQVSVELSAKIGL